MRERAGKADFGCSYATTNREVKIMTHKILDLLSELKAELADQYGERLAGVYLYGSYARGDSVGESDVDVAVVLDQVESYAAEINRTSIVVSKLSLKYGVSVSRVFFSQEEWMSGDTPFLVSVRGEAVRT
jgi:predicted nucleotidyltransferase